MLPLFLLGPLLPSLTLAADVCNGHAELCSRSYSDVTFLGTHDSYAIGTSLADNQISSITDQLNDGIRTLQVQAHNTSDGIHLCHTACSLRDGGTLSAYLTEVNSWIQSNPNDVVTLVMVNSDNLPPTEYTSSFQSAGIQSSVYSPPSAQVPINSWPTLGTLIDAKTTLVVFMDYNADFSQVPWIIDEFSNMFEDPYNVVDTAWTCAANRSTASPSSSLMMINHFLDLTYNLAGTQFFIPDKAQMNVTNSAASLTIHINNCNTLWGRKPNHILLDYYNSNGAEPFDYVATLNAVPAPTNTIEAVSITANSTEPSGSSQDAQISSSPHGSNPSGAAGTRADLSGRGWGLAVGLVGLGLFGGVVGIWV